jgi:hypothetical protein
MLTRRLLAICALAIGGFVAAGDVAAAGKDRPITRYWQCDNGRTVTINFHPWRPREEAWLTYVGNRVEVHRVSTPSGIGYDDKAGKVKWREQGQQAQLVFEGLVDTPLPCKLTPKPAKK